MRDEKRSFQRFYRNGEPLSPEQAEELVSHWARREGALNYDADAVLADPAAQAELRPHPLRATTLRELPLGTLQAEGRDGLACAYGSAETVSIEIARKTIEFTRAFGAESPDYEDALAEAARSVRITSEIHEQAEELRSSPRRAGGRRAYGRAELERVAALYSAAYASGSPQPTRDTAQALGLTWSQAAKRVMRCRRLGLLGATEPGQAGVGDPDEKPSR